MFCFVFCWFFFFFGGGWISYIKHCQFWFSFHVSFFHLISKSFRLILLLLASLISLSLLFLYIPPFHRLLHERSPKYRWVLFLLIFYLMAWSSIFLIFGSSLFFFLFILRRVQGILQGWATQVWVSLMRFLLQNLVSRNVLVLFQILSEEILPSLKNTHTWCQPKNSHKNLFENYLRYWKWR